MTKGKHKLSRKADKSPSAIAERILGRLLPETERSILLGDYEEIFQDKVAKKSVFSAVLWYWMQILITFPVFVLNSLLWSLIMIKNYLKVTFRALLKNKIFSFINIAGFALSMSICLMIIMYIKDQKCSDQFHENKNRIARVYTTDNEITYSEVKGIATTPGLLAPHIKENYPFIEDAVRLRQMYGNILFNGTAISIIGLYAEPSFLNIFSYPLQKGDPETALRDPFSIIISETVASTYFGDDDPMNKTLTLENYGDFTVTGVLKKSDQKSHFGFQVLISFSTAASLENSGVLDTDMNNWSSFERYYTYVLLKDKNDHSRFKELLPEIANTIIPEPMNERYGFKLQHLLEINLGLTLWRRMPGTKISDELTIYSIIAAVLIFLACFNYIILSIARSLKRTKEIGLRKVIGSNRSQIIKLFLSETFIISLLSLITACIFILWLIPAYNGIDAVENSRQQINIEQMKDIGLYIIFFLFTIGVGFLAGLYPALYLSSFKPVNALHGVSRIKGFSRLLTRKILLGMQLAVSLMSIIFIIYFYQLTDYWVSFDYGIETENFANVYIQDVKPEVFKNEVISNSNILGISFSNEVPVYGGQTATKIRTRNREELLNAFYYCADPEFINNFNIKLIAGRNFSNEFSTDIKKVIIVNEKTLQVFNLGSPNESIGKVLTLEDGSEVTIIGVLKDFNFYAPDEPIPAMFLRYVPEDFKYANISYAEGKKDEIKSFLLDKWKKLDDLHSFRYLFFDEAKQDLKNEMSGIMTISAWFCGFIIIIALLGLFGMTNYTTEMRTKEIGVRKVLGASVFTVTYYLSQNYIKLVLYTAVIAIPSAYILTELMFQEFAYRPELKIWVLPAVLIFIMILAIITVGSQTVKAASANPVNTLREE
ncbi:ABC transporter permease [candidate division KSB1 bacterium]